MQEQSNVILFTCSGLSTTSRRPAEPRHVLARQVPSKIYRHSRQSCAGFKCICGIYFIVGQQRLSLCIIKLSLSSLVGVSKSVHSGNGSANIPE
jgi:hypothetical protein